MRFAVSHSTRYRYSRPVMLGPHVFRVRPRCDGSQRLLDFRVRVQPRPVGWSECLDLDGNAVANAWFDVLTESLTVVSTFTVETLRANPYDFLVEPAALTLPDGIETPPHLRTSTPPHVLEPDGGDLTLAAYRRRLEPDDAVTAYAARLRSEAGGQTVPFLSLLAERIAERSRALIRIEGDPQPPAYTLREGTGACRDLAVLYIDCCRAVGLAARFVSGYYGGAAAAEHRYLHAWAEVFLPGAGWRGFDALQGVAVAEEHVAVAANSQPRGAAPIDGSLHSAQASSRLEVELHIDRVV
jgi:transglutaminase-like putative cysteine protease